MSLEDVAICFLIWDVTTVVTNTTDIISFPTILKLLAVFVLCHRRLEEPHSLAGTSPERSTVLQHEGNLGEEPYAEEGGSVD